MPFFDDFFQNCWLFCTLRARRIWQPQNFGLWWGQVWFCNEFCLIYINCNPFLVLMTKIFWENIKKPLEKILNLGALAYFSSTLYFSKHKLSHVMLRDFTDILNHSTLYEKGKKYILPHRWVSDQDNCDHRTWDHHMILNYSHFFTTLTQGKLSNHFQGLWSVKWIAFHALFNK